MSSESSSQDPTRAGHGTHQRLRLTIQGTVQGVGFRPFVYRLATELGLTGWVRNSASGVLIEVEGARDSLEEFARRLPNEIPLRASIQSLEPAWLPTAGYGLFAVEKSYPSGRKSAHVLPDIATCPDCLKEIFDPKNRRFAYPFTNCTNCGPRYSIIESLPYDRANTTMKIFTMCDACRAEYENPTDRRFHAQPNACSVCGPHLELWDKAGHFLQRDDQALRAAGDALRSGEIVALKGLGGFQLLVDARNEAAVNRLRRRKAREEKPFALMYPTLDLVRHDCALSAREEELLCSWRAPIVLLRRRGHDTIAPNVAPANPYWGIMLPYTPLHHLLMAELGFPIVATSGNLSEEPICIDESEVVSRLGSIADILLIHDRPIARQVDDSVARVVCNNEQILRSARGYAPSTLTLRQEMPPCLAVGAHLKNSIAIAANHDLFLSQHIGDLATSRAYQAMERTAASLSRMYEFQPELVAADQHPDYLSTKYAAGLGLPLIRVQHHYAHVLACLADNDLDPPLLGVAWDGTGWGPDGSVWGGEFLLVDDRSYTRVGHLRLFSLPGGEKAVIEPRRAAIGLLFEIFGDDLFGLSQIPSVSALTAEEIPVMRQMLKQQINAPRTSSAGRLFDAVASITGLCHLNRFEGQAAMMLEFAISGLPTENSYPFVIDRQATTPVVDWAPMVSEIIEDQRRSQPIGLISAKFHNTLADMIVAFARVMGEEKIALTGGCFQNKYLQEAAVKRLTKAGFHPFWHRRVPPNDGGIAVGQLIAAARAARKE